MRPVSASRSGSVVSVFGVRTGRPCATERRQRARSAKVRSTLPAALQCRSTSAPAPWRDAHEARPFDDLEHERIACPTASRAASSRAARAARRCMIGDANRRSRCELSARMPSRNRAPPGSKSLPDRDSRPCSHSVIRMRSAVVRGTWSRRATSDDDSGVSASTNSSSISQARARLGMRYWSMRRGNSTVRGAVPRVQSDRPRRQDGRSASAAMGAADTACGRRRPTDRPPPTPRAGQRPARAPPRWTSPFLPFDTLWRALFCGRRLRRRSLRRHRAGGLLCAGPGPGRAARRAPADGGSDHLHAPARIGDRRGDAGVTRARHVGGRRARSRHLAPGRHTRRRAARDVVVRAAGDVRRLPPAERIVPPDAARRRRPTTRATIDVLFASPTAMLWLVLAGRRSRARRRRASCCTRKATPRRHGLGP